MANNKVPPKRKWDKENELLECRKCFSLLPYKNFSPDKKSFSGYGYWCKECASANSRYHHSKTRANNPEYKEKRRAQLVKRNYGITLQEYKEKLSTQEHLCAICKVELPTSGSFTHLDHNHKTGKLRSFLCTNCNRGLGHFKDNASLLRKAASYLDSHNQDEDLIKEVNVNDRTH